MGMIETGSPPSQSILVGLYWTNITHTFSFWPALWVSEVKLCGVGEENVPGTPSIPEPVSTGRGCTPMICSFNLAYYSTTESAVISPGTKDGETSVRLRFTNAGWTLVPFLHSLYGRIVCLFVCFKIIFSPHLPP